MSQLTKLSKKVEQYIRKNKDSFEMLWEEFLKPYLLRKLEKELKSNPAIEPVMKAIILNELEDLKL